MASFTNGQPENSVKSMTYEGQTHAAMEANLSNQLEVGG
jgi:hypothetical protein